MNRSVPLISKSAALISKSAALILVIALACSLCQCRSDREQPGKLPNIILVMADDQGWGDMAYNGHPVLQTPNFDEMAATGLRFDHFYASSPVCSPTRGSVMTGRHPNRFGCFVWGHTLRPQETTLAEMMKEVGYVTGHFGKWHLGPVRMGSPVNPGASGFDEWFSAPNFFDNNAIMSREGIAEKTSGESSVRTVDEALDFIRKHEGRRQPYFAVVWFGSPHLPHEAAEQDRSLYPDQPENLQHFYGEVTGMDRAVGKLRAAVRELDSYENTILWYCSDNGGLPDVGSTGGRGHKGQVYEGGLRVPCIVEWPAVISEPGVSLFPSVTSDIFPTLAAVTGQVMGARPYDGVSLLPVFNGVNVRRDKPIGFWHYPAPGVRTPSREWMPELYEAQQQGNMVGDSSRLRLDAGEIPLDFPFQPTTGHAAWLDWPWKLHRIEDKKGTVSWELYNLEDDPMEENNLVEDEFERATSMKPELARWQGSVIASYLGEDYSR